MIKLALHKSDNIGILSSTLCILHCLVTPFVFLTQAYTINNYASIHTYWKYIDFLFLMVSFFAVYRSAKTTSSTIIRTALWINFSILLAVIMNEKMELFSIPESFTYIAASSLVLLHVYNLNYCQCKTDKCCRNHG